MKLIRKIAISIVLLASIFTLVSLLLPGKVIAIKVEADNLHTIPTEFSTAYNRKVIKDVFGDEYRVALSVAENESYPWLDNTICGDNGISCGLFQINWVAHPEYDKEKLKEPRYNARAALEIKNKEGWSPWLNTGKKLGLL